MKNKKQTKQNETKKINEDKQDEIQKIKTKTKHKQEQKITPPVFPSLTPYPHLPLSQKWPQIG